jgi:hypothetical protein
MSYDPQSRCPFFFFKDIEMGEDAALSEELGYAVPKLVTFIFIVPHGHKGDPMEFNATEFIARKEKEAKDGRYDYQWVKEFKEGYDLYKAGKEIPRHGTPLVTWERLLKSRREQLAPHFPTIEDLAAVPDSSLGTIGLDGRVLRDMAKGDIAAKKDLSPIVKELADTKEDNRRQAELIETLTKRLEAVETKTLHLKKVS